MFKKELPLNPDGTIDFSRVDPQNDFHLFPKIFNTMGDIKKFITDNNCDLPLIKDIILYLESGESELTPTEIKWYSDEMFDYIYDVFRIPVPETKNQVIDWLDGYVCEHLRLYGLEYFKKESFKMCKTNYDRKTRFEKFLTERNISLKNGDDGKVREINYYAEIPMGENWGNYHICKKPEIIEQFWIRTGRYGCAYWVASEQECYLRVWVYPTHVYIFTHDDASWTLMTKNEQEAKDFARFLKCGAPVWNLEYPELINRELKFTN